MALLYGTSLVPGYSFALVRARQQSAAASQEALKIPNDQLDFRAFGKDAEPRIPAFGQAKAKYGS
jgi:hypothetical protein